MPPGRGQVGEAGFTLLEVVIVLAVLGLLAGLVLVRGPPRSAALELRGAVASVAGAMRLARARAIAANRPVPLLLDAAGGRVGARALPPGVAMAVAVPPGEATGRITFLPDGSATGGTVRLVAGGGLSATVEADWLSGAVRIAGAR